MELVPQLKELKVLPVASVCSVDEGLRMCEALMAAELPIVEITFRTMAAEMAIRAATQRFPEMLIGAGTLLTPAELQRAVHAGAKFGTAPGCSERVLRAAKHTGWPFCPGVATPTDVEHALESGAKTVCFFPAQALGGVTMLDALSSAYGHAGVKFIARGGVSAENMRRYLGGDSVLAVGGSWMVAAKYLRAGDWESVTELAREARYLASHQKGDSRHG